MHADRPAVPQGGCKRLSRGSDGGKQPFQAGQRSHSSEGEHQASGSWVTQQGRHEAPRTTLLELGLNESLRTPIRTFSSDCWMDKKQCYGSKRMEISDPNDSYCIGRVDAGSLHGTPRQCPIRQQSLRLASGVYQLHGRGTYRAGKHARLKMSDKCVGRPLRAAQGASRA